MTHLYDPDPETAPCERCGATVWLQHDPPQECGAVLCPDHDHDCEDHACRTCDGAGEVFRDDPTDPPYGYHANPCPDCNPETT